MRYLKKLPPKKYRILIAIIAMVLILWQIVDIQAPQRQPLSPFYIRDVVTHQKIVALTFDDGPHPEFTPQIVQILNDHAVPATFFLLGKNVDRYPHIAQRIHKHKRYLIGNHSYGHANYNTLSDQALTEDIQKSQQSFHKHTRHFPKYFRPPYGNLKAGQDKILAQYFNNAIKWNIDPEDWIYQHSGAEIREHIVRHLKPGGIILLHDNTQKVVDALPEIISAIQKEGYQIVSLDTVLYSGQALPGQLK